MTLSSAFTIHFVLSLLFLAILFRDTDAHSFLLDPRPIKRGFNPNGCIGTACKACPPFNRFEQLNNTATNPELTWRRGERTMIRWAKNNHVGGFIRLAFVPVDKMMDATEHDRLAFYYGCWEQGRHKCTPDQACSGDKTGTALQREITIPDYLPDGIYIFGFIWFGGLHHEGKRSQFADYPSCSFVQIQGGNPVSESFLPFFDPGILNSVGPNFNRRKCLTFIEEPHICTTRPLQGENCFNKTSYRGIPRIFQNGQMPQQILSSYYNSLAPISPLTSATASVSASLQPTASPSSFVPSFSPSTSHSASSIPSISNSQTPTYSPSTSVIPSSSPSLSVLPSPSDLAIVSLLPPVTASPSFSQNVPGSSPPSETPRGICRKGICCASSCGICKIKFCASRDGGRNRCCPHRIRRRKRFCDTHSPPCRIRPSMFPSPQGICKSGVCCAPSCGKCGGRMCSKRPGGGYNCCIKPIRKSGRKCKKHPPPCSLK